jgi:hypothetical protein
MIEFTQGDTATLNLTATDGQGNPFNVTGAVFTTFIKGANGVIASFQNSQHTIVNAALGQFQLALATTDTVNCGTGPGKEILTRIVQGASTVYFRGPNLLTVNPPVPIQ